MTDENKLAGVLRDPDIIYRTHDHPEANGRKPRKGDSSWSFQWILENGRILRICMGRESRNAFREFLFQEEVDDAVERLLDADGNDSYG